jgi:iron complex outermembrane receptor protein
MHQTNVNSGEYLIPDAVTNDFGVLEPQIMRKSNVLQGLRFDNRNVTTEAQGIAGEEGSFEAIDKSYDSLMLRWVIKPIWPMITCV